MMAEPANERDWLDLTDAELLAQCDVHTYRASGPGGQKRNKTDSAVRLRHTPTGVTVVGTESRSQHENKARALRRLRQGIALEVRRPVDVTAFERPAWIEDILGPHRRLHLSPKSPAFWPTARLLLDLLDAHAGGVSDVAKTLDTATAQLVGFLRADPRLWDHANRIRQRHGCKPLR
jgi:hypothetical protein